jgi:hypothetical protein
VDGRHTATPSRRGRNYGLGLAKLALAITSTLVFGLAGYGWSTFRTLHQGLSTTDVIGPATPDKATDILLVGLDSRTDAHGDPLAPDVLARLRAGSNDGELTDTMILVRIPDDQPETSPHLNAYKISCHAIADRAFESVGKMVIEAETQRLIQDRFARAHDLCWLPRRLLHGPNDFATFGDRQETTRRRNVPCSELEIHSPDVLLVAYASRLVKA